MGKRGRPAKRMLEAVAPAEPVKPVETPQLVRKVPATIVIALAGPMRSGKSTVAAMGLRSGGTEIVPFASKLKEMACTVFNIAPEVLAKKAEPFEKPIVINDKQISGIVDYMHGVCADIRVATGEEVGFNRWTVSSALIPRGTFNTPRELLQFLGTEICQSVWKPFFPTAAYYHIKGHPGVYFIDDMRFPHEYDMGKAMFPFFYPVKIVGRNESSDGNTHSSEHAWRDLAYYTEIDNKEDGLDKLTLKVEEAFKKIQSDVVSRLNNGETDTSLVKLDPTTPQEQVLTKGKGLMGHEMPVPVRW